ncbi:MAG: hypothetical protein ACKO96_22645 [Flammeovirgaceae bacterium]
MMNCQRAEVSRLQITRQRNWGRTLAPQIGHNVPQIGGRFNAANVLLYVRFAVRWLNKFENGNT